MDIFITLNKTAFLRVILWIDIQTINGGSLDITWTIPLSQVCLGRTLHEENYDSNLKQEYSTLIELKKKTFLQKIIENILPELKTLEWWISRLMHDLLFFLIFKLL